MKQYQSYILITSLFGLLSCQIQVFEPKSVVNPKATYVVEVSALNDFQYPIGNARILLFASEADAQANRNTVQVGVMPGSGRGFIFTGLEPKEYFFRVKIPGCSDDNIVYRSDKIFRPDFNNWVGLTVKLYVPVRVVNRSGDPVVFKACAMHRCIFNGPLTGGITIAPGEGKELSLPVGNTGYLYQTAWISGITNRDMSCNGPNTITLNP